MRICALITMTAFAAYLIGGIRLSRKRAKYAKDGEPPIGPAAFRNESYTPEGQQVLAKLLRWYGPFGMPLVLIAITVAGALLCWIFGEPARP
jgi:uncharacterized protein YneF (UPF0154 family)